jgi:hypothetical protein
MLLLIFNARKLVDAKIVCFVICVEDYYKLTETQFLIQLTKTSLKFKVLNLLATLSLLFTLVSGGFFLYYLLHNFLAIELQK